MSQQYQLGRHATAVSTDEKGLTSVVYHQTAVVKFDPSHIILDSGGWQTSTTKTRMNQASNQFGLGFKVFQKNWDWFVDVGNGKVLDFTDKIMIIRRQPQ